MPHLAPVKPHRCWLKQIALVSSVVGVGIWPVLGHPSLAQTATPKTTSLSQEQRVRHVVNRLGFGPAPEQMARVRAMGVEAYIQEQLNPTQLPEPNAMQQRLGQLTALNMPPEQILGVRRQGPQQRAQQNQPQPDQGQHNQIQMVSPLAAAVQPEFQQMRRQVLQESTEQRLRRAVYSRRQLQEAMVDFWFNHFNVDASRPQTSLWLADYEMQAIRPHVMGNFRELLGATARHPAMLTYLDNMLNTDPNSPGARGRFKGLNENYARELLELHTMGSQGGYTQKDVVALARILTGWGICRSAATLQYPSSGFCFDANRHDFGEKVFLGQRISGRGMPEVEQVLDILARHPATARQVSWKLAQYFVADQPSPALVNRLSQTYLASNGNIRSVLQALFRSPEFWQPQVYQAKFKTPYQYVVSSLRVTGADLQNPQIIANTLTQMGMPLYRAQAPTGYRLTQAEWLSPDAINRRINFANNFTAANAPGVSFNSPLTSELLTQTLGGVSPTLSQQLSRTPRPLQAALVLGSPEFMRY
jgi:uncharacterized protein (DUF1800 family)